MIHEKITIKLKAALQPIHLNVINESYRHNIPAGSESHFKIIIVSDHFITQPVLTRHRAIYGILALELAETIHALAIHAYTVKEWDELQHMTSASPPCVHDRYPIK